MTQPAKASSTNQKALILNAVSQKAELPSISRMYLVGLIVTAAAVLLVPLLYLATMALLLGSFFAMVQQIHAIMPGCHAAFKWPVIATLMFLVAACVLGLVKPFFARPITVKRPRSLDRDAEPFLFEYIERLCDTLGACRPTDIHVTCDLNAAAEFRRGWLNPFGPREISLYLGVPVVGGLTLRQLTGVLAHELGHFTQRTAMGLENIVTRTNLWFVRAAHERDAIDDWLQRQAGAGGLMGIPCFFAQFVVWATRKVLLGLASAGAAISCLMSRQMELSADLCQARMVGYRTLTSTLWRMRELSLAHQTSFRDVALFYAEGRLPNDMVALVLANIAFITPRMKRKLRRMIDKEKTGLFDSHPSDRDRIEAAAADGASGAFEPGPLPNDLPASVLFTRFDELSQSLTTRFFETALNQKIKSRMLHPVEKLLERQTVQIEAAKALRRYFQTDIPHLRPLPVASQSADVPDDPRETANELRRCRERMLCELPEYNRLVPRYRTAEETLFETIAVQSLLQSQLPFDPKDYHFAEATTNAVTDKQSRAREGVAKLAEKMLPFESEAGNRLSFALQLLHVPAVVDRISNGEDLSYEIGDLLPEAKYVSQLIGELPSLRIFFYRLQTLVEKSRGAAPNPNVADVIANQVSPLRSRLIAIQADMGAHLYPFDHARADTTLREFALPLIPSENDPKALAEVAEQMQSRLVTIQMRLFARLAQVAEKIELAIGMPPLPEPHRDVDE